MSEQNVPVKLEPSSFTQILIAVFVIVLTLVVFALYRRRKNARRAVLLTGLCDSGKTLIYSQLVYNKFVNTHTSIKENLADYIVKGTSLRIIDLPGHERLRDRFFEQYKSVTRGVVFVIDSVTAQKDIRDVAEFFFNILSDPVLKNNTPFLILCNKQDNSLAKGMNVIKTLLEKELHTVAVTKSRQLDSVDPKAKRNVLRNNEDGFDFNAYRVEFAECNASSKDNSGDIEELRKWLLKIA